MQDGPIGVSGHPIWSEGRPHRVAGGALADPEQSANATGVLSPAPRCYETAARASMHKEKPVVIVHFDMAA